MNNFHEDFRVGIEAFFKLVGYQVEITDLANSDILAFAIPSSKNRPRLLVYFFVNKTNALPNTLEVLSSVLEEIPDGFELIKFAENNDALTNYQGLMHDPYLFASAYPAFLQQFMKVFANNDFFSLLAEEVINMYKHQKSKIAIEELYQNNDKGLSLDEILDLPFIDDINGYVQLKDDVFIEYYLMQEFNLFDKSTCQEVFIREFTPLMLDLIEYEKAPKGLVHLKELKEKVYKIAKNLLSLKNPKTTEDIIKAEKSKRKLWNLADQDISQLMWEYWPHYDDKELSHKINVLNEIITKI